MDCAAGRRGIGRGCDCGCNCDWDGEGKWVINIQKLLSYKMLLEFGHVNRDKGGKVE